MININYLELYYLKNKKNDVTIEHIYKISGGILMERERVIQEYVPGKQITLAHLIAHPDKDICKKLGLNTETTRAIGILTITPGEAAIIAADIATKSGQIEIGFLDLSNSLS